VACAHWSRGLDVHQQHRLYVHVQLFRHHRAQLSAGVSLPRFCLVHSFLLYCTFSFYMPVAPLVGAQHVQEDLSHLPVHLGARVHLHRANSPLALT
jgi:hypothetical protein